MDVIPESGVYVLVIRVRSGREIEAGALGRLRLRRGYYAYVGRARRGLSARLRRHRRGEGKRVRWHIDYLLDRACLEEIWVMPLAAGECALAAGLEGEGASREGLRGFGSSDCRCAGHLLYLGGTRPHPPRAATAVVRPT